MTEELITSLINTISTLSPMIWGIYVRQAVIDGIANISISIIATTILTIFCAKALPALWKNWDDHPYGQGDVTFIIIAGLSILIFMLSLAMMSSGIQQIINPEYYAIQGLLNAITGGN